MFLISLFLFNFSESVCNGNTREAARIEFFPFLNCFFFLWITLTLNFLFHFFMFSFLLTYRPANTYEHSRWFKLGIFILRVNFFSSPLNYVCFVLRFAIASQQLLKRASPSRFFAFEFGFSLHSQLLTVLFIFTIPFFIFFLF